MVYLDYNIVSLLVISLEKHLARTPAKNYRVFGAAINEITSDDITDGLYYPINANSPIRRGVLHGQINLNAVIENSRVRCFEEERPELEAILMQLTGLKKLARTKTTYQVTALMKRAERLAKRLGEKDQNHYSLAGNVEFEASNSKERAIYKAKIPFICIPGMEKDPRILKWKEENSWFGRKKFIGYRRLTQAEFEEEFPEYRMVQCSPVLNGLTSTSPQPDLSSP